MRPTLTPGKRSTDAISRGQCLLSREAHDSIALGQLPSVFLIHFLLRGLNSSRPATGPGRRHGSQTSWRALPFVSDQFVVFAWAQESTRGTVSHRSRDRSKSKGPFVGMGSPGGCRDAPSARCSYTCHSFVSSCPRRDYVGGLLSVGGSTSHGSRARARQSQGSGGAGWPSSGLGQPADSRRRRSRRSPP